MTTAEQPPQKRTPRPAAEPARASLLDAESRGGPTAIKGLDFQRRYALILLLESLTDPDWRAVLVEGAEDVETRFERQGQVERRAIQLKNYRVTAAMAREIVSRLAMLDADSPGTWRAFVIACTGLDDTLRGIHNSLERYRPAGRFYKADDGILAETRTVLERQLVAAKLPVEFVLERVSFEPELQPYNQEAWVRARSLALLQESKLSLSHAAADEIYLRLKDLVSESTARSIERRQVEEIIAAVRVERGEAGGRAAPLPLPPIGELPEPGTLPAGSRLPFPRNAVFTGRRDDLLALAERLLYSKGPAPVVACGIDGVGKTQLAVELCYRYGRCLSAVHWLDARTDPTPDIAACGQELGIQPWPDGQPDQVAATLRGLGGRSVAAGGVGQPGGPGAAAGVAAAAGWGADADHRPAGGVARGPGRDGPPGGAAAARGEPGAAARAGPAAAGRARCGAGPAGGEAGGPAAGARPGRPLPGR